MGKDYFGIALYGLGRAGMIHFHNLRKTPRADLLYIVEMDTKKAQQLVEEYRIKDVQVIPPEDSSRALQDSRVEAVIVATPTYEHKGNILQAVAAGKPVFCEKPIGLNEEETRQCYDAAKEKKLPLLCSFNRRYDPAIMEVKRRYDSGEVGQLHMIKSIARDHPRPPNAYLSVSGGIYHDCIVHDLDLICWIVGQYPTEVHAYEHTHDKEIKEMNDADTVAVTVKFANGILAMIDISRHASYGYDQRLELFGMNGMIQSENQRDTAVASLNDRGTKTDVLKHSFPQRYSESYINALDNFFNILKGTRKLDITKESTLQISRLASACEESGKTGKNIVMADFVNNIH